MPKTPNPNPNPNPKRKRRNATNALADVQMHKSKISMPGNFQQEMIPLLKTLGEYENVFARNDLTILVQELKKACEAYDYSSVLRWLDNLEKELKRIIMSKSDKSEQEDAAAISPDDAHGHDCEQSSAEDFWLRYALKQSLLEQLTQEVIWALSNPRMRLRAMFDWEYALWLELSIAILEKNGIYIIES